MGARAMTFKQFQKSWWSWLLFAGIAVAVGFSRGWDKFSLILAGVFVVTGILRLFSAPIRRFGVKQMASQLANMPADQRERELQRLSPDQRAEIIRELENHAA